MSEDDGNPKRGNPFPPIDPLATTNTITDDQLEHLRHTNPRAYAYLLMAKCRELPLGDGDSESTDGSASNVLHFPDRFRNRSRPRLFEGPLECEPGHIAPDPLETLVNNHGPVGPKERELSEEESLELDKRAWQQRLERSRRALESRRRRSKPSESEDD